MNAAFRNTRRLGQPADGQAIEPFDRRQLRRMLDDPCPRPIARASSSSPPMVVLV
jgi:hypothetical protein